MNLRQLTLHYAQKELAKKVVEVGGDNRGPAVEMYQKAAKVSAGAPWCAAFLNWCAEQAARDLKVISPLESVPLQAYVQSYFTHFNKLDCIVPVEQALPGDLVVFWYDSLKRYAHIGIVMENRHARGFLLCIEGNTNSDGSREGNAVAQKLRPITKNVKIIRWTRNVIPA